MKKVLLLILACLYPALLAGQVPGYISSMSDYQVRAMSSSYAPTNGKSTVRSVTPSEWLTSDPGAGLPGIINAWSGGYKPLTGTKLYVYGGGHNDSANNGLYVFDYSGMNAPTGWTIASQSPVSAYSACSNTYSDGKPSAIHTYDGLIAPGNGFLYRFAGYVSCGGGQGASSGYKFNLSSNTWTAVPRYPGPGATVLTMYDPETNKILIGEGQSFRSSFFRVASDTMSATVNVSGTDWKNENGCMAFDTVRKRGVKVGSTGGLLITPNFPNETVFISALSASGATVILTVAAPSCFYEPTRDVYWMFGGVNGSAGWTNVYEMNASTFAITGHALSGDAITVASQVGSYGRFVWMPAYSAIGVVASVDSPAYVIKLPSSTASPTAPPAPSQLQISRLIKRGA